MRTSTSSLATPGRFHLTESQRRELLELIAANPMLPCSRIADMLEARTGRRLSSNAVRMAWVRGYKPSRRGMSREVPG